MKYAIYTLGCKVNQFETQAIEAMLASRGFDMTGDGDADVVIINTCAVTAESGRKSRQAARRLKSQNPGALLAVCGCFSQISPEELEELGADIVFGSSDKQGFVNAVEKALAGREKERNIDEPFKRAEFELLPAGALEGRTRAYMKIEDGCENFCSYCVIPFARGRVLSMPLAQAREQALALKQRGFQEIIVTGIEIASYGKDLRDGTGLADVVEAIADAATGVRIHLGSLEPTVITDEFCRRLAQRTNMCRHFHLSLQSGCDETLKKMRRKYDTERFLRAATLLRAYFPGCALTADLITGFPGETDGDHEKTLEFIKKCGFAAMHVFPYSQRPGTRAAQLPGQLTHAVKNLRANQAQAAADGMQRQFLSACIGQTLPVLFETEAKSGVWRGHADNYCEVEACGKDLHAVVRNVKIETVEGENLIGKIVDFECEKD